VHAVAGAALAATFLTSVAGVAWYSLLPAPAGVATHPDWFLGGLFGLGGLAGMYLGAAVQPRVPQRLLKLGLGVLLGAMAAVYLLPIIA
jgi:uncharacterized membrane protein YfcA